LFYKHFITMLRENFPEVGSDYLGGISDGWEYKTTFLGSTLEQSLQMVSSFLAEEGFADIPLPANAKELRLFKKAAQPTQLAMFRETGYIHNPIKILFHPNVKMNKMLMLHIYNEKADQHLLRFHGVL
jgi:hypothetical protein